MKRLQNAKQEPSKTYEIIPTKAIFCHCFIFVLYNKTKTSKKDNLELNRKKVGERLLKAETMQPIYGQFQAC